MLRHILVIAKNTFKETVRDRIILGASILAILMMLVSLFIASISLDQDIRIIVDLSLTAIYVLQVFIAVFIGSNLFHKEMERKTFFLLLPKPASRESVILGKALGLVVTTTVVTLITSFALSALLLVKGGTMYLVPLFLSILMSTFEVFLLVLIAFLFSLFTSSVLSALFTLAIFLIGHSGDILVALIQKATSFPMKFLLEIIYYVLPNLEKFNLRNEVIYKVLPDTRMIIFAVFYAVLYSTILFFANRYLFKKKEF